PAIGAETESQLDALSGIGGEIDLPLRPTEIGACEGAAVEWETAGISGIGQCRRVTADRGERRPGGTAVGRYLHHSPVPSRLDAITRPELEHRQGIGAERDRSGTDRQAFGIVVAGVVA